jgi:UrcA family protein
MTSIVLGSLATAQAASHIESVFTVVHYGDLNLSREPGALALYGRISAAATNMCGSPDRFASPAMSKQQRKCTTLAVEKAVRNVGSATLRAVHEKRISGQRG